MTAGTVVITGGIVAAVILLTIVTVLCCCRLQVSTHYSTRATVNILQYYPILPSSIYKGIMGYVKYLILFNNDYFCVQLPFAD